MIIHDEFQQGSTDWFRIRAGIVTASELDQILTPNWEIRRGAMPDTYLATKLAEWWLGGALPGFNSWDTEQGKIIEEEARGAFELETGLEVRQVGFITDDVGEFGCSPDGLLEKSGVEIKCLQPTHHVSCLIKGDLPKEFGAQVHGSMCVTGFASWNLFLYRRNFPSLRIEVPRDEEIVEVINEALGVFQHRFEIAKQLLINRNGGPSRARQRAAEAAQSAKENPVRFTWQKEELEELIP